MPSSSTLVAAIAGGARALSAQVLASNHARSQESRRAPFGPWVGAGGPQLESQRKGLVAARLLSATGIA
eukprot:1107877-Rhodomonas_salina.2